MSIEIVSIVILKFQSFGSCLNLCYCRMCTGEEVVSALGSEVDRLEKDIQRIVPGILHVDIEAHNPNGPVPREKFYLY